MTTRKMSPPEKQGIERVIKNSLKKGTAPDIVKKYLYEQYDMFEQEEINTIFSYVVLQEDTKTDLEDIRGSLPVVMEKDLKHTRFERRWVAENLVPENGVVLIAGRSGTYKTYFAMHWAVCIASGKPIFGSFRTQKGRVVYIDEENDLCELTERMESIKAGMGLTEDLEIAFLSSEGIKIEERLEQIEDFLTKFEPSVIIVDTLRRVVTFEENDAGQVSAFFTDVIKPIIKKHGCTWIFLHHMRKSVQGKPTEYSGDMLRGSSELLNIPPFVFITKTFPNVQDRVAFIYEKTRGMRKPAPIMIQLNWRENPKSVQFENLGAAEEVLNRKEECAKRVLVWLQTQNKGEFSTEEVVGAMKAENFSKPTIEKALALLLERREVSKLRRGIYLNPYVSNTRNHPDGIDGSMVNMDNASIRPINTYTADGTDGRSNAEK
jgi:hypothetical protein